MGMLNLDLREGDAAHDLTPALWASWTEAAAVTFERFHDGPPQACLVDRGLGGEDEATLHWRRADERAQRSHANTIDATEVGAYAVATLVVHALDGWRVIARTPTESGADLWIARESDGPDAQVRLEVSGVAEGQGRAGVQAVRTRLKQKVAQLAAGNRDEPGIAVVVGFQLLRVCVSPLR